MILRTSEHATSPPLVLNITGLEPLRPHSLLSEFGKLLGRETKVQSAPESATALLSDAHSGPPTIRPAVNADRTNARVDRRWISAGGETWNKPTHFEVRDGKF